MSRDNAPLVSVNAPNLGVQSSRSGEVPCQCMGAFTADSTTPATRVAREALSHPARATLTKLPSEMAVGALLRRPPVESHP